MHDSSSSDPPCVTPPIETSCAHIWLFPVDVLSSSSSELKCMCRGIQETGGGVNQDSLPMATRAPVTGSMTVMVDPSPSSISSSAPASSVPPQLAESVVLRLKRRPKKVTWKEGTVDNESLGRKSSKKCCIFHKEVPFDEDCSDDEPDGGSGGRQSPLGDAREGTSSDGGGCCSSSSHGHDHGH